MSIGILDHWDMWSSRNLLDGIAAAVETEETLRWQLVAAQETVAIWRTESANNRALDRAAA